MKVQDRKTHGEHLDYKQVSKRERSHTRAKKETLFDLLKKDHESVMDIFDQIDEEESTESLRGLFSQLQDELDEHMQLEEQFFYPALKENDDSREKILESYEQHQVVKTVLSQMQGVSPDDERWVAKIKVLSELVNQHMGEEEKEVFKMAKRLIEKEKLREIVGEIEKAKRELIWH